MAAVRVADERGIGSLTMRNLAQELGVEAMSLYYHVANKQEVLDGIVEVVVDEINASHDGASTLGWCDDQFEFEFGLDLILDGLERLHGTA